ncbi:DNA-binding protein [Sulfurovum lithotrophicum]|uniref:DNA-binding protein n=1 Tax=Sulfurovum lithotrophicum TaxID=206403 RepID=A0A7U4RRD2_9BACT|nr:ORF6N domain-containing protein [Sulfurovum lithotrophicum]AKF25656.1 DNA-binding protein [Sulfurovum lithotrophicum]
MNELTIPIHDKIYTLRGKQIMLDEDLAELYQIETRILNQAVKRNIERFPEDFMFQLTEEEYGNLKSQFVISSLEKHGGRRKLPFVFTENGVYMLSAVLKSQVAIDVSIEIMRTFTKLREFTLHYNALGKKIIELERKNDKQFKKVFDILDTLMNDTQRTDEKVMGFIKDA